MAAIVRRATPKTNARIRLQYSLFGSANSHTKCNRHENKDGDLADARLQISAKRRKPMNPYRQITEGER